MSSFTRHDGSLAARSGAASWGFVLAGLVALYAPSYWDAWHGLWQADEFGHIPLVFAVTCWLVKERWARIDGAGDAGGHLAGWLALSAGLLLFLVGRTLTISSVEFASQPLVAAGALWLLRGPGAVRAAWFALLFLCFMIPLPATLIDAITGPLKGWVSTIVVNMLYAAGYPIARSGVVISIGPYQLLVADACSGLNSMLSLSALGALYMYLAGARRVGHLALMVASILPIAFVANIVRVVILVLITYHLGDEAGQGFLHGAAGMILMLVALASFLLLDTVLGRIFNRAANGREAAVQGTERPESGRWRRN